MPTDEQNSNFNEQLNMLKQQLQQQMLEQQKQQQDFIMQLFQQQQQQPINEHQPSSQCMETSESLHSFPTRPKFDWNPSPNLVDLFELDQDLFVGTPLNDRTRANLIDQYPPIKDLDYQPPESVPEVYSSMSEQQKSQDAALKSVQYLLSAIFRPLDILAHELYTNQVPDSQKYLKMVYDTRTLVLNATNSVNQFRTNLGLKPSTRNLNLRPPMSDIRFQLTSFTLWLTNYILLKRPLRKPSNLKNQSPFEEVHHPSMVVKIPTTATTAATTTTTMTTTTTTPTIDLINRSPFNPTTAAQIFRKEITTTASRRGTSSFLCQRMAFCNQQQLVTQHPLPRLSNSIHSPSSSHFDSTTNHPTRLRTTLSHRRIDSRPYSTTSDSRSHRLLKRFLQLNIRDSQKEQRHSSGFQPKSFKPIHRSSTVQNGNVVRSFTFDQEGRLPHLNRPTLSVHSCSNTSSLEKISTFPLARKNLGIYNSSIWSEHSSLLVHQTNQTNPTVGKEERHPSKFLFGRSDLHRIESPTNSSTHTPFASETSIARLAHQHVQISISSSTTTRTPGFSPRHDYHVSQVTKSQDQRFEKVNATSITSTNSDTSFDTQSDDENTSGHLCSASSTTLHQTSTQIQESVSSPIQRLGHSTTVDTRMPARNTNMVNTFESMEWKNFSTSDTKGNVICRRERHRLGLQLEQQDNSWLLESTRSPTIYQLEGIEGGISCNSIIQDTQHQSIDSHGQYYIPKLHKQTGWNEIATLNDTRNQFMEVLFETPDPPDSTTHPRSGEQHYRQRIPPIVLQKPMEDTTTGLSTVATSSWVPRRRPFRGSHNSTPTKIRVLETRSGRIYERCFHDQLGTIQESLDQSALESHHQVPSQDSARTITTSYYCSTPLAISYLLPGPEVFSNQTTNFANTKTCTTKTLTDAEPTEAQVLEAICMAALNNKLGTSSKFSFATRKFIADPRLCLLRYLQILLSHLPCLQQNTSETQVSICSLSSTALHQSIHHVNDIIPTLFVSALDNSTIEIQGTPSDSEASQEDEYYDAVDKLPDVSALD